MKKFLAIIALALSFTLILSACGDSSSESPSDSGKKSEEAEEEQKEESDQQFHDNVFENDDVKIEITKYEVIQPGDTTYSEYNIEEKPVIAFWYKVTNKSGEETDPSTAWILNFKAIQDNDPNSVNELDVSGLPDDKYLDSQTETIKKGGTVECCCGYVLDDEKTPVTLVASDILGGELGSQEYKIK